MITNKKFDQWTSEEYKTYIDGCHRMRAEAIHNLFVSIHNAIKNRIKKIFKISCVEMPKPHFTQ